MSVGAAPVARVEVADGPWVLEVVPERGASLSRVAWRHPDGEMREICRRPSAADIDDRTGSLSKLSSFLMLPFANRIDGARFDYDGAAHTLPLNRPEQNCAIHGHSRQSAWAVVEAGAARLVCEDDFARPDTPWRYRARQVFEIREGAARLEVSVENRGAAPLPFGFGHHPWFPRAADSRLRFAATRTFETDARTFPVADRAPSPTDSFADGVRLADRVGFDQCFAGWSGTAEITQPGQDVRLTLTGDGAYRLLHVYVAADRPDFCVEPVTHAPDVVNRRQFAPLGDMARLAPGETLSAVLALRAGALSDG